MSTCHFAIYHTKCMVEGGRECLYVTLLYTTPSAWLREGVSVYMSLCYISYLVHG